MKTCADVDSLMTPFIDGELEAGEAADVEQHLAACPPCDDRATCERTARLVVHARAAEFATPAPALLRARCVAAAASGGEPAAAEPGWRRRVAGWVPLSVAATLLLAVGGVFLMGQNDRLEAAFVAQLALDHDRCFGDLHSVPGFGQREAEAKLANDYGWHVSLPAESHEFDVVDVRRCMYDAGDMAHVLCEWRGQPVSLFVAQQRAGSEDVLEIMGRNAVTWTEDDSTYVLMAKGGRVDMGRLATYVRPYTD